MILGVWVFFLLGDPLSTDHGTPYVQMTASEQVHSTPWRREDIEAIARLKYDHDYPGHAVCDSGWCRQRVWVVTV